MSADPIYAWHWLPADGKLANGDARPVVVGEALTVEPPLMLCSRGLHASRRIIDSLQYAPGPIVCYVRCEGEVVEGPDKLCCSRRTVLALADATTLLHEFACDVAEEALRRERQRGREPDSRCWAAIAAKRQWLRGEIDDARLAAAWDAAWDAASAAAWDAASAAAWAAARAAARDAASAAAWAAASAAARDAAWDAASAAAWDAASAAAWDAQNARLDASVRGLLGLPLAAGLDREARDA